MKNFINLCLESFLYVVISLIISACYAYIGCIKIMLILEEMQMKCSEVKGSNSSITQKWFRENVLLCLHLFSKFESISKKKQTAKIVYL